MPEGFADLFPGIAAAEAQLHSQGYAERSVLAAALEEVASLIRRDSRFLSEPSRIDPHLDRLAWVADVMRREQS